jgi:hypothetical protein
MKTSPIAPAYTLTLWNSISSCYLIPVRSPAITCMSVFPVILIPPQTITEPSRGNHAQQHSNLHNIHWSWDKLAYHRHESSHKRATHIQKEQESSDKIVSWYGFEPIWSMAVLCLGANWGGLLVRMRGD